MRTKFNLLFLFSIALLLITDSCSSSAQLLTSSAGLTGPAACKTVFKIIVPKTRTVGTGFLHKSGSIITAAHVISGCAPKDVMIELPQGNMIGITKIISDEEIDISALTPMEPINGNAIPITQKVSFNIGAQVSTWGFPGGYNGRRPMLSVGYLSGTDVMKTTSGALVERFVVNAAFNRGNSGGPLIDIESRQIIGVVSSKLNPVPEHIRKALNHLKTVDIGVNFSVKYKDGSKGKISQSKLLADILEYMRKQTQLVVGHAITPAQLIEFIDKHGL